MARRFGTYSPVVPLGVTWEEQLQLLQTNGDPVDLTGYDVRVQFRVEKSPLIDVITHIPTTAPVFELTTAGAVSPAPAWPLFESWTIADVSNGTLNSLLDVIPLWKASPTNVKRRLYMSIILVNPETLYAIPVVQGRAVFLPAVTV